MKMYFMLFNLNYIIIYTTTHTHDKISGPRFQLSNT